LSTIDVRDQACDALVDRQRESDLIAVSPNLGSTRLPRWLHCLAVLTVCATVALLALGAVVTTFQVGMADPIWPTYPWHLLLIDWREPSPGFLIEHTHRLAGYIVGVFTIVLAAGLWRAQPNRKLGWLGVAALLGVIIQGLLGGFRVRLNALVGTDLAWVHGSFAQLVFVFLLSLALFTSAAWISAGEELAADPGMGRLRCLSLAVSFAVYLQLVLGGLVRHNVAAALGQRGHLLVAFGVVVLVTWLVKLSYESPTRDRSLVTAATLLAGFLVIQLFLGVEAWVARFASGLPDIQPVTFRQAIIRTAHYLVGSAIFASSAVVTLRAYRLTVPISVRATAPFRQLERAV
jgi:heme a synthase